MLQTGFDALMPPQMAKRAEQVGAAKAATATGQMFFLAVLAGAFIALGAVFATTVAAGAGDLPFGVARLLAGVAFCLGLILVVVAGAELFTGNNLIVIAVAAGRVPAHSLLRNWGVVYAGNLVGALATVALLFAGGQYEFGDGAVGETALTIAQSKASLGFGQALALGIMCNALVCIAIWMTYSARSVADKVLAILFPITAFVAAGFEHSIANMYFLPIGVAIREWGSDEFWATSGSSAGEFPGVSWLDTVGNLIPVTIGNVIGGSLMVGLVYWAIYLRRES